MNALRLLGMDVYTSPHIPERDPRVDEVRSSNLDTLAHGGSIIDCEPVPYDGPVVFMFCGHSFANPRTVAALRNVR